MPIVTDKPGDIEAALEEVRIERAYQDRKWGGPQHDDTHNSHDWIAYIVRYAGRAVMWPFNPHVFRRSMVKVAALAVAAIQWEDRRKHGSNAEAQDA